MTSRGLRTLRGTAAACFAVFVAALFHDAAGGGLPSLLAVSLSLAFAVPLCVALAGRRISLWRQAACVGVSQLLLHLLFGLGSNASGIALHAPAGHMHMDEHLALTAGTAMPMHSDSPLMFVAHGCAALITVAALRHGERTLHALATFTALLVTAIARLVAVAIDSPARMPVQTRPLTLASPRRVLGSLRHRGPPAFV
ncbi:hypothetical protein GCM10028798_31620 [Humibacter antri]